MTSTVVNPQVFRLGGACYHLCGQRLVKASGPRDGDTKPGASGTLVFKNGRWRKQESSSGTNEPSQLALLSDDFGAPSDESKPMKSRLTVLPNEFGFPPNESVPMDPAMAFDWIDRQDNGIDLEILFYELADRLHIGQDAALEMTGGYEDPYVLAGAATIAAPLSQFEEKFVRQAKAWNQEVGVFDEDDVFELIDYWRLWTTRPFEDFQEALDSDRLFDGIAEIVGEDRLEAACIMLEWA